MSFSSAFSDAVSAQGGGAATEAKASGTSSGVNADVILGLMEMNNGGGLTSDGGLSSLFGTGESSESDLLSQLFGTSGSNALLQSGLFSGLQQYQNASKGDAAALSSQYDSLIERVSGSYGVDASLVKALIKAESGFDADAKSSAGAMGLMQLMPATCETLGVLRPYDPEENVEGGVRALLGHILSYEGDVKMALAAYNCGSGTLQKLGITELESGAQFQKLPSETQSYIAKIYGYLAAAGKGELMTKNFFD